MAELATVARPYAEAAFRAGLESRDLDGDARAVALAATIAGDEAMRPVLTNPRMSVAQKKELFFSIAGDRLSDRVRSLVALLLESHRESLLPWISVLLEEFKREHERVLRAKITSALPLDDAQRDDIIAALERQYGRKIEAELDVDPELLGGARVQIGDQVIHASVRDALAQMAATLAR